MRRFLACALLCSVVTLSSCDVFNSLSRTPEMIHMYGDAININTFQPIVVAAITVQVANKTLRFTGSYDVQAPVNQPLVISATAPGYRPYQIKTTLNPQGSQELRSPLMMRPLAPK